MKYLFFNNLLFIDFINENIFSEIKVVDPVSDISFHVLDSAFRFLYTLYLLYNGVCLLN